MPPPTYIGPFPHQFYLAPGKFSRSNPTPEQEEHALQILKCLDIPRHHDEVHGEGCVCLTFTALAPVGTTSNSEVPLMMHKWVCPTCHAMVGLRHSAQGKHIKTHIKSRKDLITWKFHCTFEGCDYSHNQKQYYDIHMAKPHGKICCGALFRSEDSSCFYACSTTTTPWALHHHCVRVHGSVMHPSACGPHAGHGLLKDVEWPTSLVWKREAELTPDAGVIRATQGDVELFLGGGIASPCHPSPMARQDPPAIPFVSSLFPPSQTLHAAPSPGRVPKLTISPPPPTPDFPSLSLVTRQLSSSPSPTDWSPLFLPYIQAGMSSVCLSPYQYDHSAA